MNRELAATVLETFKPNSNAALRKCFDAFQEQDWVRTTSWLHTSGLALYFLRSMRELEITDVMPIRILRELEKCHAENRDRTSALFDEFVRINVEFQRAEICYANLKGFSLAPRSCPDPSYRYQHDLDFLVNPRDAEHSRQAVTRLGYRLKRVYDGSWEFIAGTPEVLSMKDLYRAHTERTLEIHFASAREQSDTELHGDRLSRLQLQVWNGFEFPGLSDSDRLLGQAQHLFRHLQREWTRVAWMLEFATNIRSHDGDSRFWQDVIRLIDAIPQRRTGIGLAALITSRSFSVELPPLFREATVENLPRQVRLWADCYQDEIVYAEHPGSKLYLLLQDVLAPGHVARRGKLLPLHLPPRVAVAKEGSTLWARLAASWAQVRFTWQRLRFHVTSGVRYKLESARWKRLVAHLQS